MPSYEHRAVSWAPEAHRTSRRPGHGPATRSPPRPCCRSGRGAALTQSSIDASRTITNIRVGRSCGRPVTGRRPPGAICWFVAARPLTALHSGRVLLAGFPFLERRIRSSRCDDAVRVAALRRGSTASRAARVASHNAPGRGRLRLYGKSGARCVRGNVVTKP